MKTDVLGTARLGQKTIMNHHKCLLMVFLLTPAHAAEDLSPPEYEGNVKVEIVRVPMRDGVELAVRIIRPDAEGEFPGVMSYSPYRRVTPVKTDYSEEGRKYASYLAERGYAMVDYDVRGTGNSGGWSKDIYSDDERRDGYDMVEWIADQPWSNGNVGMIGISYLGVVQWQVAVQNPPHLKAIIVRSANDSVYTEWTYPGGVLRPYMFDTYSPLMTAYNFSPPDPEVVGAKWSALWQERLEHSQPWGLGYISHPLNDDYWLDRSLSKDYSRVKAATLVIGGWSDVYPTALLRAYSKIKAPKHALVGPWRHIWPENEKTVPGPRIDGRPIYLRWFDYWLKGKDNGVMDEPPVTLYVKQYDPPMAHMPLEEPGFWRHEKDWPIPRAQNTPMYFHPDGKLSRERHAGSVREGDELEYKPWVGITSGIHWGGGILPWGNPIDQRWDEAYSLVYTTPPLEEDVEVSGHPQAVLYVSSTADVAYFRVKLIDVAPDGTSKLVRYGGLNATHRDSDLEPKPLTPGEVYELKVDVKAMAYEFEKGHRIRVAIANADIQNAWPTPKNAVNTVYHGPRTPSHIVLPIIPPPQEELGEPDLVELPTADADTALKAQRPSRYSIEHDLLNQTTTVYLGKAGSSERGPGTQETDLQSSFTVSHQNPANAHLKATFVNTIKRPDSTIEIKATELTSSNEEAFRHISNVEIFLNGALFFNKSWSKTVPREHN